MRGTPSGTINVYVYDDNGPLAIRKEPYRRATMFRTAGKMERYAAQESLARGVRLSVGVRPYTGTFYVGGRKEEASSEH